MAQYIPKTAWKVNNIAHRYGAAYVGLGKVQPNFFASTRQPSQFFIASEGFNSKHYTPAQLQERVSTALQNSALIDLRDRYEREADPLTNALELHHHDVLSGACCPLLPSDKSTELIVVAAARQRAVNGFNALQQWGYHNVVVVDSQALKGAAA